MLGQVNQWSSTALGIQGLVKSYGTTETLSDVDLVRTGASRDGHQPVGRRSRTSFGAIERGVQVVSISNKTVSALPQTGQLRQAQIPLLPPTLLVQKFLNDNDVKSEADPKTKLPDLPLHHAVPADWIKTPGPKG